MKQYTVYLCESKNSDKRNGHTHFSEDANSTLCGKIINENWFICDNTATGKATCPRCVAIDKINKQKTTI